MQFASRYLLIVLVILFGLHPSVSGEDLFTSNDGPHVYWQNDTTAIVFYLCDDSVISITITASDTIRFAGFCGDSTTEYIIPTSKPVPASDIFNNVSKVFAMSDVHGDYEEFVEILVNTGVIDSSLHWVWGEGHFVITGDVVDRGDHVTECLWLIYRLELEAARAGGAVHMLLGNHELMVIRGDLRYVQSKYMKGIGHRSKIKYDHLFGQDMELGRWLRSKNTVIRINKTLFVHGGVAPEIMYSKISLNRLNELARMGLDNSAPTLFFSDTIKQLYGTIGPFWYRGYIHEMKNYPATTSEQIDSLLEYYEVEQIVVGHSQHDSVTALHQGRIIAIDVRVEDIGGQEALLWKDGHFYRVTGQGQLILIK